MNTSKTQKYLMVEWEKIPWRKLYIIVSKLQKRIYKAEERNDTKTVHKLQKLLLKSTAAKLLAVRKVAQDNRGRKSAGLDGLKELSSKQKVKLASILNVSTEASPTKRVWIPKPGKSEQRPLGIPTIHDRALQALVKFALEPQWEAKFEPNSYGFRPGRSAHDAISAIFLSINRKPKYVLDADIASCFDRIDHQYLLNKLNAPVCIRKQVRLWLKAGVMDNGRYKATSQGTPQGGVISPLLANIALHGLEEKVKSSFTKTRRIKGKREYFWQPKVIRYADDFVVLHQDLTVIQTCKQIVTEYLKEIGLELKESKTSISHTLKEHHAKVGFDFLGFTIRQIPVGLNHSGCDTKGRRLGFKTIICPGKKSIKQHQVHIHALLKRNKNANQEKLISLLNPVIRGWSNYFSKVVSKATFSKLDHVLFHQLRAWVNFRHKSKNARWKADKYWKKIGNHTWTFACVNKRNTIVQLFRHSQTAIVRHVKVQGERSPYNGQLQYWENRKKQKSYR